MKKTKATKKPVKRVKRKSGDDYDIMLSDYHPNHDQHLCSILTFRNMKTLARLSKDAKYICFICGRAAKHKRHLCAPVEI
jgi:hypothetical protein